MGERHTLSASGCPYDSDGERVLDRGFVIGDEPFAAGAAFAGRSNLKNRGPQLLAMVRF